MNENAILHLIKIVTVISHILKFICHNLPIILMHWHVALLHVFMTFRQLC